MPPCLLMQATLYFTVCRWQQAVPCGNHIHLHVVDAASTPALLSGYVFDKACCSCMQATVQGALGSVPLLLIQSRLTKKADYTQYEKWGNEILHATAFSILITAPVGLLVIGLLGKTCLKQVSIYRVSCCLVLCSVLHIQTATKAGSSPVSNGLLLHGLLMLPWIMLGTILKQHLVGLGAPFTLPACLCRASLPLQRVCLQSMLLGLPLMTMTAAPLSQM